VKDDAEKRIRSHEASLCCRIMILS
jgi:hypothetical protein